MIQRKALIALLTILTLCPVWADEPTTQQKAFRASVMTFLKEEGFSPYIDEDNSLCFKKEGELFWLDIADGSPFYVEFNRSGFKTENANADAVLKACNMVNRKYKCVKVLKTDKSARLVIESFCHNAEAFKYTFYKGLNELERAHDAFEKYYDEFRGNSSTSLPFSLRNALVGITEDDGTFITDFGSTLYSSKTKYLSLKLYLEGATAGTYKIYVKMFTPSGTLSTGNNSPTGYSFSESVNVKSGSSSYILKGWGSKVAGHWKAGDYRFEIYYSGKKIGEKEFTIY